MVAFRPHLTQMGAYKLRLGRALEWHSRGQRFDPAYLHHKTRYIVWKSPEVERFQDFFFTFKILTLGTDWNLTGTGFFCKKRLIECLHRFLLDRRLHMQIMLCHIQIRMTNHTLYQRNSFHVKGWPVSKSRPFTCKIPFIYLRSLRQMCSLYARRRKILRCWEKCRK